jgi:hypothetical protein
VIVHGGAPCIDHSFSLACEELGIEVDLCLVDFSHVGDYGLQNREMLRRGAELCLICHRSVLDQRSSDLTRQAILAGVPTYVVESDDGKPRRILAGDARLK